MFLVIHGLAQQIEISNITNIMVLFDAAPVQVFIARQRNQKGFRKVPESV